MKKQSINLKNVLNPNNFTELVEESTNETMYLKKFNIEDKDKVSKLLIKYYTGKFQPADARTVAELFVSVIFKDDKKTLVFKDFEINELLIGNGVAEMLELLIKNVAYSNGLTPEEFNERMDKTLKETEEHTENLVDMLTRASEEQVEEIKTSLLDLLADGDLSEESIEEALDKTEEAIKNQSLNSMNSISQD